MSSIAVAALLLGSMLLPTVANQHVAMAAVDDRVAGLSESGVMPQEALAKIEAGAAALENSGDSRPYIIARGELGTPNAAAAAADGVRGDARNSAPNAWEFGGDILLPKAPGFAAEMDMEYHSSYNSIMAAYSDFTTGPNRSHVVLSRLANGDPGSWVDKGFLAVPAGTAFHSDPVVSSTNGGQFHVVTLAFDGDSSAIMLQRYQNNGATPMPLQLVAGSTGVNSPVFYDKEWIATDTSTRSPYMDRTYMCYTKFDDPIGTSKIMVKRIYNGLDAGDGVTLETAGTSVGDVVQGCNIDVGPDGQVAVMWFRDIGSGLAQVHISRSYNGGATWTAFANAETMTRFAPSGPGFYGALGGVNGLFRTNQFPDIAWDRLGGLHMVVQLENFARPGLGYAGADIFYFKSTNCATAAGACTFTTIAPFNTAVNNDLTTRDQFHPNVIVSESDTPINTDDAGFLGVVFKDKREDGANLSWRPWSAQCDVSTSAGACLGAADWSTHAQVPVSFALFSNSAAFPSFVGEYDGLETANGVVSSSNRNFYTLWFDNVGGVSDVYFDRTLS